MVRTRNGKLQIRLAHPDKITKAAEQAFLVALSATANVRLSAAAAGASARAFYRRRRQDLAFDRETRTALRIGYDRLEAAAMERSLQAMLGADSGAAWLGRAIEGNPLPPLSWNQAFQLLCKHHNVVRLGWPTRGSPHGGTANVPAALAAISRNIDAVNRTRRYEESGDWRFPDETPPPPLQPLELVTGWSKADPAKIPHHPGLALFGGWRIDDMRKRLEKG